MVTVSPLLTELPALRMNLPIVKYANQERKIGEKASWNLGPQSGVTPKFISVPRTRLKIHLLVGGPAQQSHEETRKQFLAELRYYGYASVTSCPRTNDSMPDGWNESIAHEAFRYAAQQNCDTLLIIRQTDEVENYAWLHTVADCHYGMPTINLVDATIARCWRKGVNRPLRDYLANIALKANLHSGGVNHHVVGLAEFTKDTMVVGVDVTHPCSGSMPGVPSLVGSVASMDEACGTYYSCLSIQEARTEVCIIWNGLHTFANDFRSSRTATPMLLHNLLCI